MMAMSRSKRIRGLSSLVGNTPLLAITFSFRGKKHTLYAKAEHLNMPGSIKDRMAFHIMECGYAIGLFRGDKRQGGNTL